MKILFAPTFRCRRSKWWVLEHDITKDGVISAMIRRDKHAIGTSARLSFRPVSPLMSALSRKRVRKMVVTQTHIQRQFSLYVPYQLRSKAIANIIGVFFEGIAEHGNHALMNRRPLFQMLDQKAGMYSFIFHAASNRSGYGLHSLIIPCRQVPAVNPGIAMKFL